MLLARLERLPRWRDGAGFGDDFVAADAFPVADAFFTARRVCSHARRQAPKPSSRVPLRHGRVGLGQFSGGKELSDAFCTSKGSNLQAGAAGGATPHLDICPLTT